MIDFTIFPVCLLGGAVFCYVNREIEKADLQEEKNEEREAETSNREEGLPGFPGASQSLVPVNSKTQPIHAFGVSHRTLYHSNKSHCV